VRSATGERHNKLRELVHQDFATFSAIESELAGYDAWFFCLGVTSAGLTEEKYRRVTFDFTLAAAQALLTQSSRPRIPLRVGCVERHAVDAPPKRSRSRAAVLAGGGSVVLRSLLESVCIPSASSTSRPLGEGKRR